MIFKEGDDADCGNYRPICLLNVAYKVSAMILLHRLVTVGADDRIMSSQFGFRRKRGTEDALHCARRAIELALAQKNGSVHLLALDWRKAFDSISPAGLLHALKRFGMPCHMLDVVGSIYKNRVFRVRENGALSSVFQQGSGICQDVPCHRSCLLL